MINYRNAFLAALSPADISAFGRGLAEVSLGRGQTLFEVGDDADVVYFPSSAVISIVTVMRDGRSVETATVGCESGVALLDAATGDAVRSRIFTQVAGAALRLPARQLRSRLKESWPLARLLMLHAKANTWQSEQNTACNTLHDIDARLSRWLLMTADRVGSDDFPLTQDYMAVMTGTQRTTISATAAGLKASGVIAYSRGHVRILDRHRLESHTCECYHEARQQFDGLRSAADEEDHAAMSSAE